MYRQFAMAFALVSLGCGTSTADDSEHAEELPSSERYEIDLSSKEYVDDVSDRSGEALNRKYPAGFTKEEWEQEVSDQVLQDILKPLLEPRYRYESGQLIHIDE